MPEGREGSLPASAASADTSSTVPSTERRSWLRIDPVKNFFSRLKSSQNDDPNEEHEEVPEPKRGPRLSRRQLFRVSGGLLTVLGLMSRSDKPVESEVKKMESFKAGRIETEGNLQIQHGRWLVSHEVITNSPDGLRRTNIQPEFRPVVDKQGRVLGEVMEVELDAAPGDEESSLTFAFKLNPDGNYSVLTNGWSAWSSPAHGTEVPLASQLTGKKPLAVGVRSDQLIGRKPFEKSLGGMPKAYFEPGPGGEQLPSNEGRSYGWLGFRDQQNGENVVLGVIPGLDATEVIKYRQEGDQMVISVSKNLEGVTRERKVPFKIFLGSANPREEGKLQYADLQLAFSRELARIAEASGVPLMKDRVIGFSWASFGFNIDQDKIQQEVESSKGIIDTYIIDAGWQFPDGSLNIDRKKFPDMSGLIKQMKDAGIKPGLWLAPFMVAGEAAKSLPEAWFIKSKDGKPKSVPMPFPEKLGNQLELDISIPEVRQYLAGKFAELSDMGFETFKIDWIATPFNGGLKNKDRTSVEYYRQVFGEIRQQVREQTGKEIELIGCGDPMMESIGLFNGTRITPDSALPYMDEAMLGKVGNWLKERTPLGRLIGMVNTGMYADAVAVAARRPLLYGGSHGLILDGVHINDLAIPFDAQINSSLSTSNTSGQRSAEAVSANTTKKGRINQSLLALNRMGMGGNLFVGDSLSRVGEQGREVWRSFIEEFKAAKLLDKLTRS